MTRRGCVPFDRLTALALVARAPEGDSDRQLLAHVADCRRCAARLVALTSDVETLREAAWQEADALFDDSALEIQRTRILDRLANLGKSARVLRFPARVREAAMPVSSTSRRWVSVAAAAGLIIGLLAGQLIHFVPWDGRLRSRATSLQAATSRGSNGPVLVQASSTATLSSDDQLLDEIDEAVQSSRAASLRALDAFTPHVGELVEIH